MICSQCAESANGQPASSACPQCLQERSAAALLAMLKAEPESEWERTVDAFIKARQAEAQDEVLCRIEQELKALGICANI